MIFQSNPPATGQCLTEGSSSIKKGFDTQHFYGNLQIWFILILFLMNMNMKDKAVDLEKYTNYI